MILTELVLKKQTRKPLKRDLVLMMLGGTIKPFAVRTGIHQRKRKSEELDGKNNTSPWKITTRKMPDSQKLNHARWT